MIYVWRTKKSEIGRASLGSALLGLSEAERASSSAAKRSALCSSAAVAVGVISSLVQWQPI